MDGEMTPPLCQHAGTETVQNVVLFIADSTRPDAVPQSLRERGVSVDTIAPSTFTGSSVPSILGGNYPSEHKVWGFDGQVRRQPALVRRGPSFGMEAPTIWLDLPPEEKPPLRTNDITDSRSLDELDPPFVYVNHDKGDHAPYGQSFEEVDSAAASYREHVGATEELRAAYERGVEQSVRRFESLLAELRDRSLLDETLVVFTSDHGELLGEAEYGGVYGHGLPMVPPVVAVPTVFLGAGLPGGRRLEGKISGVDIAPTLLGALGESSTGATGTDLWRQELPESSPRTEVWMEKELRGRSIDGYIAVGVWDEEGGVVTHRRSVSSRLAYALYHHFVAGPHAPLTRRTRPRRVVRLLRSHLAGSVNYGAPNDPDRKRETAEAVSIESASAGRGKRAAVDEEQLEKLGYI